MIKSDEKTEKAIRALLNNPDFVVFTDALKKNLQQLREDSDTLVSTDDMFRNQGARIEIVSILKRMDECRPK